MNFYAPGKLQALALLPKGSGLQPLCACIKPEGCMPCPPLWQCQSDHLPTDSGGAAERCGVGAACMLCAYHTVSGADVSQVKACLLAAHSALSMASAQDRRHPICPCRKERCCHGLHELCLQKAQQVLAG